MPARSLKLLSKVFGWGVSDVKAFDDIGLRLEVEYA